MENQDHPPEKPQVPAELAEVIGRSRRKIMGMTPCLNRVVLDAMWIELAAAAARGVKVQLLVEGLELHTGKRLFDLFGENIEIYQAPQIPACTQLIVDSDFGYEGPPLPKDFGLQSTWMPASES